MTSMAEELGFRDAPDALGEMYIEAVRSKNRPLMNAILRQGWLMGKYTKQLTPEEQQWACDNTEE